ncbi:MAG: alcohol dehydrogenase catalytic domain-containing protein [Nitrospirota bacterium]
MNALLFDGDLKYREDHPVPNPGKDEALIRVTYAGICNTDIEITKGYMGFKGIPGHEFVGVVEKSDNRKLKGKRVTGEINIGCNTCSYCRDHLYNHCPKRSVLGILARDGVFAEYTTLPLKNLHELPDSVSDEEAVFIEPLAAAYEILEQVSISSSDKVCVLGDGKMGLLIGQVLSTTGCNLIVIGKHPEKLSILDELGINTKLSSQRKEKEFDIVVDCTGSRTGMETALGIVKPRGKIIIKTTVAKKGQLDLNGVVINELSLIGSRCGPFLPAINAIASRDIDLFPLISDVFKLEDGLKAFENAKKKGVMKVILKI